MTSRLLKTMGNLPPFAPFPPAALRAHISPEEWNNYQEAWILLAEAYLNVPDVDLDKVVHRSDSSLTSFVQSYVQGQFESPASSSGSRLQTIALHKSVFLLCHRLLLMQIPPPILIKWRFLAQFAHSFSQVSSVSKLLTQVWQAQSSKIEESLHELKKQIILAADGQFPSGLLSDLQLVSRLIKLSPFVGYSFAVGSELIDSLANIYPSSNKKTQEITTTLTYFVLLSTIQIPKPNNSLLPEHLFSLKTNASTLLAKHQPSLLSSLVSNTNLVTKLRAMSEDSQDEGSLPPGDYTAGLLQFKVSPTRSRRSKSMKQKGKAPQGAMDINHDVHLHRMSRITHIQDFLPHLGSGFIAKCLDAYNEDEEAVLASLLDNNLPPNLASADQSETLQDQHSAESVQEQPSLPQPQTILPSTIPARRNVFDNDELDNLAIDASRLHIGKAHQDLTADALLSQKSDDRKAKIFASLAAFDPDSDEHDDTYDDDRDVGGTMDNTVDTDRSPEDERIERILFRAWQTDPSSFARDNATRKLPGRTSLKQETGASDEQIEGFAIMLQRDRNHVRSLERKYADEWNGQQKALDRRAWRATEEDDDSGHGSNDAGKGRGRGGFRGRTGGRGGLGANTAGPSDEQGTQRARNRKEVRGTHNRKDARGKKFARGMA